jgi:hypothetical protein
MARPKTDQTKPARRSRAQSQTTAAIAVKPKRKRGSETPTKRSLLQVLLRDPRLTEEDKADITKAHRDGISLADVAALCAFELTLARSLFEEGRLEPKDYVIAVNKMSSHATAVAQLSLGSTGGGAAISVTFNVAAAPSSVRPEAMPRTSTHRVIGDIIEAE